MQKKLALLFGILLTLPMALAYTCNTSGTTSDLTIFVSEWMPTNQTTLVNVYYTSSALNNTPITTGNVSIQITGSNAAEMTYNATLGAYQAFLYSNITETDILNITAYEPNYLCRNYSSTIRFAEFVQVCISIYESYNKTTLYKNEWGHILANQMAENQAGLKFNKEASMMSTQKVLAPVAIFSAWGDKTFGLNYTRAYPYYRSTFHAPYTNGQACVNVPKNYVYNFVFVSGDWIFSNLEYDRPYWTKINTAFSIGASQRINNATNIITVATPYEQNPRGYIYKWGYILIGIFLLFGLPTLAYIATQDAIISLKLFITLLSSLSFMYFILSWFLW